jgi:hypothetical protein|nr:MAG TPA: hypothetical protein [Bacteriophage sp.]
MKPFDLQEALNGAPVKLRNGNKAYIIADYIEFFPFNTFRLQGVCLVGDSKTQYERNQWTVDGVSLFKIDYYSRGTNPYDIIGMWEELKSDTITVTLPKPFKPKEGEVYYSICGYHNGMIDEMHANCMTHISILSGNCFRTESDAKAWLDAMKNALDD